MAIVTSSEGLALRKAVELQTMIRIEKSAVIQFSLILRASVA